MEMIPEETFPYLPSLRWLVSKPVISTREYTRAVIESNSTDGMVLTVPVVGGASAAKRLKPADLEISSHGDWTRIHLGAIEAAYGREPFFQHFFPEIEGVIKSYPPMLVDMNARLMQLVLSAIMFAENADDIRELRRSHPERYENLRCRMLSKTNPAHSIIEPLFRFGPDLIFLLNT